MAASHQHGSAIDLYQSDLVRSHSNPSETFGLSWRPRNGDWSTAGRRHPRPASRALPRDFRPLFLSSLSLLLPLMKIQDLSASGYEETPPDPRGTATVFQRIGYELDQALADLLDNSIDANAKHVRVRLVRTRKSMARIIIADNGHGMARETLRQSNAVRSTGRAQSHGLGQIRHRHEGCPHSANAAA